MRYDVFGMCNALFDLQAQVEAGILQDLRLRPGGMYLLDADQHAALVSRIRHSIVNEAAGGSGANTMIGIAALGGKACFTSRVGRDDFGPAYIRSLADAGVQPDLPQGDGATGLCVVLITPDRQRTMCTYLGEGRNLRPEDVSLDHLRQSSMLYVTGYLWDTETQMQAVELAIAEARAAGLTVAMSLSDTFCIERHHADFTSLLAGSVDVVFGNEDEARLLAGAAKALDAARTLGNDGRTAFITLGGDGALVARNGQAVHVPAQAVPLVDTTGAGDAFAAGTLYGLTHGMDPIAAAGIGSQLAASVVSHMGPRPPRSA
jgi:sugar/nucleoside kinase (ribokinase family)